jgi:uncharacterized RDD family membrane protein YckC
MIAVKQPIYLIFYQIPCLLSLTNYCKDTQFYLNAIFFSYICISKDKTCMADTTIITGQYVQIDQTPVGIGERMLGRIIDILLMAVYFYAITVIFRYGANYFRLLGDDAAMAGFILFMLPVPFYSLLCELFNRGQSPGKKLLGIRVVMKDGTRPTLSAYLLRWLMLLVDIWLFQWIGVLSILMTKNNQRLGDLAAGTLVIKEKDFRKINVSLDEFRHLSINYRPIFPQAETLSLEQVNLINEIFFRRDPDRPLRIRELGAKVREFLHINPPVSDENLLQTLLRDYQFYALEEI